MNKKTELFSVIVIMIGMMMMILPSIGPISFHTEVVDENVLDDNISVPESRGTRGSSPRTVLVELFTNWACFPHCPYANAAMNELLDVYDTSKMTMVAYHTDFSTTDPFYQHNPSDNNLRHDYYGGGGVPTIFFDGPPSYNHFWDDTYNQYTTSIENELSDFSPLLITLEGEINSMTGTVDATIEVTDTLPGNGDLKIRFAIIEDNKYADGPNGEVRHRNAMRDMLTEETMPILSVGEKYEVSRSFGVHPLWDLDTISIVVFVQNDDNKEVMQSSVMDYIPQKILVVDDDQTTPPHGYEDDYAEILCLMGISFDGWMYDDKGPLTGSDLEKYEAVIWITADTTTDTLTDTDRTAIMDYFDNSRGGLFLNGEDIEEEIGSTNFFWDYLHGFVNSDTTGDRNITGIAADPISDPYDGSILEIAGSSPSSINPWTANASTIFSYSPSFESAAIKSVHDFDSRIVYFPFLYFEGPDSISNKQDIMERVLQWLVVKVDYIQITDAPGPTGVPQSTLELNVGQSKTLWAAAYNHTYGFLENYPITTWDDSSDGSLVTITTPGGSSLITAGMTGGSSSLSVDYFGVRNTTSITVNDPTTDYVTITDTPNGIETMDLYLLANENITLYASGYNVTSGYMGLMNVNWMDSAGLGSFDNTTGTSTTFTAGIVGGVTIITADSISPPLSDSVGTTVVTAGIDYIQIRTQPGGLGVLVISDDLDVGQSRTYWCAMYNDSAGYLGDSSQCQWSEDSSGQYIDLSTTSGKTVTVTAQLVGGSATLEANVNGTTASATITVNPPEVDFIQINYQFGPGGTKVEDPIYTVGEELTYFGASYNHTASYLSSVPSDSTWTSSNPLIVSAVSPGSSSTITVSDTEHGMISLTLDDGDGHSHQVTITVLEATIDFIRIRSEAGGLGDIITSPTYDVGYEVVFYSACYNHTASFLGDLTVSWDVDDESVGNITPTGGLAVFTAVGIGTVELTLEIESVQLITVIVVVDETDPIANAGSSGNINEGIALSLSGSLSSDNGIIVDYHWDLGDGNSYNGTDPDMEYTFSHPGVYTVILTVTDAGGNTNSDSITITVWDITTPTAVAILPSEPVKDMPLHFDASTSYDNVGVISYEWDFGDGSSYMGEYENVTHIYSIPGTYTVNLTVKDAAGHEDSFESQITIVDRTPPASPKGLIITPQPGGNSLEITWEGVSDPDLNHYDIYVSINEGEYTKANENPISKDKPSFLNSGLSMGNSYRYYVVAYDNSENGSPQSPIVEGYPDIDTDSDGVYDREDEDDDDDGLTDYQEYEKATDPKNPDTDSDGRVDGEDAFPHDETEFRDSDFDGVGDTKDDFPKDATEWKDSDGDGIGDSVDFLPIHNLLFYLIMAIVIIVIIVVSMAMVKRRRAASVSFDGNTTSEQVPETQAPPPDFDSPVEEPSKVLPAPPKKNLPPPPKKK